MGAGKKRPAKAEGREFYPGALTGTLTATLKEPGSKPFPLGRVVGVDGPKKGRVMIEFGGAAPIPERDDYDRLGELVASALRRGSTRVSYPEGLRLLESAVNPGRMAFAYVKAASAEYRGPTDDAKPGPQQRERWELVLEVFS